MVEGETAYATLLQPIRDLALNWDIDVASALEDYLEELDGITITLGEELREAVTDPLSSDDAADTVNFAQAALLIQGSALIYSKKVEYLLQLVNRTLHVLSTDKTKVMGKAASKQAAKDAVAEDEAEFMMENFLTLDNVIKEGRDIDIDQPAYNTRSAPADRRAPLRHTTNHPMMAALLKEDRGSSFRMNSCRVHASGALVIGSSAGTTSALDKLVSPAMAMAMSSMSASQRLQAQHAPEPNEEDFDDDPGMDFDNAGAADDSFDGHDDYVPPMDDGPSLNDSQAPPFPTAPPASLFGAPKGDALNTSRSSTSSSHSTMTVDPWGMLDPHDPSDEINKPIKVAKCYILPKRLRPGYDKEKDEQQAKEALTSGFRVKNLKVTGLAYPEFEYIAKRIRKLQAAERRREKALQRNAPDDAEYASDDDDGMVNFGVHGEDTGADGDDFDGDFDVDPSSAFDQDDVGEEVGFVAPLALDDAFRQAPKTYADMCREHIASFMRGVNEYTNESQLSQRVGEWQTRLGPVLEEQARRRTFDIREYGHEIMGDVAEHLETVKADNQPAKPSKRKSMAKDEEIVPLAAVTAGKPSYDVCRIFLASLQLANEGNLLLHHPDDEGVCGLNDLRVQILSDVMSEERFDQYRAPSVAST